jgi:hypothetical protein
VTRRTARWTAAAIAVAVTVLMLGRLFVGGPIGLGDQGDGHRLMCSVGVADAAPFTDRSSGFAHLEWRAHHWYGETCGADASGEPYQSTELWLLWPAKALTAVATGRYGNLDLRALGVLCAVLAGLLCGALFLALPGRSRLRAFVAVGTGFVLADAGFAGYFVSPFSEPAALLGMLAILIALLVIWRRGHATAPTLVAVVAAAAFTIAAKTQNVSYLLPLAVGLLCVPHRGLASTWRGLLGWAARRWPAIVAITMLTIFSAAFMSGQPQRFSQQGRYDAVFTEMLPHGTHPAADLRSMGLDPAWASASDSNLYSPNALAGTPAYTRFVHEISWSKIGEFYLTHPGRFGALMSRGLAFAAELRPGNLGSYPEGSGHPALAQEHRICLYSWAFRVFRWANFLMVAEWIALALAGLLIIKHAVLPRAIRAYGHLALWIPVAALPQFAVVMLTEGSGDAIKHMVFVDFLTALGLPVLAVCCHVLLSELRATLQPIPQSSHRPVPAEEALQVV